MRDLTDEQVAGMTPEEKAEYAHARAAAKYTNPEAPGEPLFPRVPGKFIWGGAGTLVLLGIAAATLLGREYVWKEVKEMPNQHPQSFGPPARR